MNKRQQKKRKRLSLRIARRLLRYFRSRPCLGDFEPRVLFNVDAEAQRMLAWGLNQYGEDHFYMTPKEIFRDGRDCCQWFDDWARGAVGDL